MRRLVFSLCALALLCGCGTHTPPATTSPGAPLRYETLLGATADVPTGKPVVINFFASWCTPCLLEMPDFEKVHQRLGERVEFLGLNVQEDAARANKVKATTAVTYPLGLDRKADIYHRFGGITMPTTVILAADGTTAEVHGGALTAAALEKLLADKVQIS